MTELIRDGVDRVTGVRARTPDGAEMSLRCIADDRRGRRTLHGCSSSTTRRWSGEEQPPGGMLYRYFTGLPASGYEWAYGERAAAGLIPTNDGTCVFVGTTSARIRSLRSERS